jgi:hypothetical protein
MRYLYPILWQKCYNDFAILLNFLFTLGKLLAFHLASWHIVYNLVYNVKYNPFLLDNNGLNYIVTDNSIVSMPMIHFNLGTKSPYAQFSSYFEHTQIMRQLN